MARRLVELSSSVDLRDVLPTIRVPTLVLHRAGDPVVPVHLGRDLAERIPGATFVELPSTDSNPWTGDVEAWFGRFEDFLAGARRPRRPRDRVLLSVLFTDLVGSTQHAGGVGDERWHESSSGTTNSSARRSTAAAASR
jgi:hypothetical protein